MKCDDASKQKHEQSTVKTCQHGRSDTTFRGAAWNTQDLKYGTQAGTLGRLQDRQWESSVGKVMIGFDTYSVVHAVRPLPSALCRTNCFIESRRRLPLHWYVPRAEAPTSVAANAHDAWDRHALDLQRLAEAVEGSSISARLLKVGLSAPLHTELLCRTTLHAQDVTVKAVKVEQCQANHHMRAQARSPAVKEAIRHILLNGKDTREVLLSSKAEARVVQALSTLGSHYLFEEEMEVLLQVSHQIPIDSHAISGAYVHTVAAAEEVCAVIVSMSPHMQA